MSYQNSDGLIKIKTCMALRFNSSHLNIYRFLFDTHLKVLFRVFPYIIS